MLRTRSLLVVLLVCFAGLGCRVSPQEHVKRAEKFVSEKKYGEAIVEYRTALQIDAKVGGARLRLADLHAQQGDVENAYREYIRAADTLPDNDEAQLKAGAMLLMANRFAEAKTRADHVLSKTPRSAAALMLLGNALAGMNDLVGAFRRLNEAVEADPGSGPVYANIGALQLASGDKRMAEASFKKAINADPKSATARVALASYYRSQNRDLEAEAMLLEASKVDPKNVQVNSNLVEMYIRTGRAGQAEAPLKAMVDVMANADARFALAEYYLRTDRPAEAAPILKTLTGNKDTYALATTRLAAVDYQQGRAAEAHNALDEVLKREPNNRAAFLLKGQLLSVEKKLDAALGFLKQAVTADPSRSAEPNIAIARIYVSKGQLENAQDIYKDVLTRDPRSVTAQLGLAQLYAARGEFGSAAELARGAVSANPSNAAARLTLARTLIASGDIAGAEREIRLLHDSLPPTAAVEIQLGALFLARNERANAKAAFAKALTLGPDSPEALAGLIGVDLTSNNRAAAIERLEARLREAPNDKNVQFLAAHLYYSLKDFDRSAAALRRTIALDASNLSAYAMLGGIYGAQSKLDDARQQFQNWATQQPRSVAAHTMLALLFEKEERPADARKAYEKILEIDPKAAIAANNLAFHYAETGGNLDVALQLAQTAQSQVPNEPEFNDTVGWVYYKQDNTDLAVRFFRRAIDRDAKNPQFHYHLGLAHAKQGEDSKAIAAMKQALALNPTFDHAADAKKALSELQIQ
jgi:tetratricopeptide (TPR) repeat protein